jgi:glyoxylase-like metal-dependent hydrolase (beta-lactamase superfamily II)/rhodanese-related sulfurtransferase
MERNDSTVTTDQVREWLDAHKRLVILDVRPNEQRQEWQIPGSVYFDAYEKLKDNDPSALDELSLPDDVPVVTVCAAGRVSMVAANQLRKKGIEAFSLKGGMKAWSTAWNTATLNFENFSIVQFRRTGKGCLSYMIISSGEAIIIDASLPVEIYAQAVAEKQVSLKFVLDTHIHADHLSRSKSIAEMFGVPLLLPAQDKVTFNFTPVKETDSLEFGNISIKPIATPGHTMESIALLINEKVLLTGDTLFTDSVGRPDLKADSEEAKHKSLLLFDSLQKLIALDGDIIVLPGHTSKPVDFNGVPVQASLSSIKENIPILRLNKQDFVETIVRRLPATPANYLTIVEKNIVGDLAETNATELEAGANRCAIS